MRTTIRRATRESCVVCPKRWSKNGRTKTRHPRPPSVFWPNILDPSWRRVFVKLGNNIIFTPGSYGHIKYRRRYDEPHDFVDGCRLSQCRPNRRHCCRVRDYIIQSMWWLYVGIASHKHRHTHTAYTAYFAI